MVDIAIFFQGHELAIKILYQLFTIIHSEFDEHATSVASSIYDNFLLSLVSILILRVLL